MARTFDYQIFSKYVNQDKQEESEYYKSRPYIAIGSDPFRDEDGARIPKKAEEFYEDFGPIIHPRTGEPIQKLSDYQYQIWNDGWIYKLRLAVKTHRAGVSESSLYEDFQKAITICRGYQILVVMQTQEQAEQMLYRLRKNVQASERYSKYLINKQNEYLFKSEVTKASEIFINNPDSEIFPTRIMAKGVSEGSLWSLEKVKHVHMSDIAAAKVDYAPAILSAQVRMATTDGTMLIESPPRGGTKGKLYDLWKESKAHQDKLAKIHEKMNAETMEGEYKLYEITWRESLKAGIMSEAYLRQARKTMTPQEFASYHEAQFVDNFGDLFDYDSVLACENRGRIFGGGNIIELALDLSTVKSIGFDPGHGSSNYAICALEWVPVTKLSRNKNIERMPGILRVIYCYEFSKKLHGDMVNKIVSLYNQINARKLYGGAVNPEVIRDVKIGIGERKDYENVVARAKKMKRPLEQYMTCIPIPEAEAGADLNSQAKAWVESGLLVIDPDAFPELPRQMKNAVTKPNGQLDKTIDNYDSLDAFKNALKYFKYNSAVGVSFGNVYKFPTSKPTEE